MSNHAITTNTTHSSENIFQTHYKLPLSQLPNIAARYLHEGLRGARVRLLMVS